MRRGAIQASTRRARIDGGELCVTPEGTGPCPPGVCPAGEHFDPAADTCVADVRIVACGAPPAQAVANTATEITQHWDGDSWEPSSTPTFSSEPSTDACRFICAAAHEWDGSACVAAAVVCEPGHLDDSSTDCAVGLCPAETHWDEATASCVDNARVVPCPAPPRNGVANTATEITQFWDGEVQAWPPLPVLIYDPQPATDACIYTCRVGFTQNEFGACVGPPERIDCAHAPGEQGDDLYWVDEDGLPVELVEDCVYRRSTLNCAGTRMSDDGTIDGIAKAAATGLNPEAFLGCCGPNASTIDVYGCLPYQELDEPCYGDLRYFGKCVDELQCSNAGPGSPYPQSCQE